MSYIDSLSPIGIFYLLVCIAYGLFIGIIAKNASLGVNIFIPCLIVTITVFTIFILRFFELPNLFSYRIAIFSFFITLFILNILMITVGRKNTNIEHLSGVSIVSSCEIGGKTGTCYDINGNRQCITPQQLKTTGIVIPDQSKNVVGEVEVEVEEETKKITCNDIVNYQKTSPLVASDCLTDNNMTGIIYPPLGERCVSHAMVAKCKKRRNAAMKKAATIRSKRKISEMRSQGERSSRVSGRAEVKRKPAIVCSDNHTSCHDPSDIGFFEDECSNISTNGGNWGLRKFEQCDCPSNEKVGVCAQGYHYGDFIDKDSSSCDSQQRIIRLYLYNLRQQCILASHSHIIESECGCDLLAEAVIGREYPFMFYTQVTEFITKYYKNNISILLNYFCNVDDSSKSLLNILGYEMLVDNTATISAVETARGINTNLDITISKFTQTIQQFYVILTRKKCFSF